MPTLAKVPFVSRTLVTTRTTLIPELDCRSRIKAREFTTLNLRFLFDTGELRPPSLEVSLQFVDHGIRTSRHHLPEMVGPRNAPRHPELKSGTDGIPVPDHFGKWRRKPKVPEN